MASKKQKPPSAVPVAATDWPASKIEMWPLSKIIPYDNNPRSHPPEEVDALALDMREDGVTTAILVDEKGVIIFGHCRRLSALKNDYTEYPVMVARGWTEEKKRAVRIKDNARALMGGWDDKLLRIEVGELKLAGYQLNRLGFPKIELTGLLTPLPTADGQDRGKLLELVNVVVKEPRQVDEGARYMLGGRHHLLCVSVIDGWPEWGPLLKDEALFCPYPGIFVPFSGKAEKHTLVMVQPDPYIAGHILDRYVEVYGKKSVKQL